MPVEGGPVSEDFRVYIIFTYMYMYVHVIIILLLSFTMNYIDVFEVRL